MLLVNVTLYYIGHTDQYLLYVHVQILIWLSCGNDFHVLLSRKTRRNLE
jgi:hypothetical protein